MNTLLTPAALEPGPLPATYLVPAEQLADLLRDRDRLDRLARYLQLGESSVFTVSANEPRDEKDTDDDHPDYWNRPYVIGHSVELEHRGCYRFETLGKHRTFRTAIDLAMDAWEAQVAVRGDWLA